MIKRLICLTALATGLLAAPAGASCIPATENDRLRRAQAVFTGRVLTVSPDGARARFRVLSVRKGNLKKGDSVWVRANPYPTSITLAWHPKVGQRWRLYVRRVNGKWSTNDCMGTRRA